MQPTMPLRARLLRRLEGESGFGLIELMVAIAGTLVVFLAASNFWEIGSRNQADTGNRVEALGQQRVGLERMTRELRGARRIDFPSPGVVDFDAYAPAAGTEDGQVQYGWRRIVYDCSTGAECRRYEGPVGSALDAGYEPLVCVPSTTPDPTPGELSSLYDPAECEVDNASFALVGDADGQECDPEVDDLEDCNYVAIELWVAIPERDYPISLSDGVHVRNHVTGI